MFTAAQNFTLGEIISSNAACFTSVHGNSKLAYVEFTSNSVSVSVEGANYEGISADDAIAALLNSNISSIEHDDTILRICAKRCGRGGEVSCYVFSVAS